MLVQGTLFGVSLMLVAQVVMPMNDALAKYLVSVLPVLQVAWARFFLNAAFIVPYALWRGGKNGLAVREPKIQIFRGLTILIANLCFIIGVRYVPLADALAIVFIAPLAVTALSAYFLGEWISKRHWAAVICGFGGALIIVRPGFESFHLASLLPFMAGLLFAVYLVLTRWLVKSSSPEATQAFTAILGAILLSFVVPFVWVQTEWYILAMMTLVGLLSSIGHIAMTVAHVHAPASTLAPLTYLALVTATILGYLFFDDLPDIWTVTGAVIVIASGLYIGWQTRPDKG